MGRDHVHLCFAGGVSAGTDGGNHLAGEIKYRGADTHGAVNKFADGDTDVLPANFFNLLSEGSRVPSAIRFKNGMAVVPKVFSAPAACPSEMRAGPGYRGASGCQPEHNGLEQRSGAHDKRLPPGRRPFYS